MSGLTLAGVSSVAGTSMAQSQGDRDKSFEAIIEASLEIQQRRGLEARKKFLKRHGVSHTHKRLQTALPDAASNSDGVSTQSHFDCVEPENCNYNPDLELAIAINYDMYNGRHSVDLSSRYRYRYYWTDSGGYPVFDGPANPNDGLGLTWEKDHWVLNSPDYPADSTYTSDETEWDNGSCDGDGAGFIVDDEQVCYDTGRTDQDDDGQGSYEWSRWAYGGAYVDKGSNWQDGDEIQGIYSYTWNDTGVGISVGVSFPWGISVSFDSSTTAKTEDVATNPDGKALDVTASEA